MATKKAASAPIPVLVTESTMEVGESIPCPKDNEEVLRDIGAAGSG
jgi:hypothetical protein